MSGSTEHARTAAEWARIALRTQCECVGYVVALPQSECVACLARIIEKAQQQDNQPLLVGREPTERDRLIVFAARVCELLEADSNDEALTTLAEQAEMWGELERLAESLQSVLELPVRRARAGAHVDAILEGLRSEILEGDAAEHAELRVFKEKALRFSGAPSPEALLERLMDPDAYRCTLEDRIAALVEQRDGLLERVGPGSRGEVVSRTTSYRGVRIEIDPAGSRRQVAGFWHDAPLLIAPDYIDGAPDAQGVLERGTTDRDELLDAIDELLDANSETF